VFHVIIPARYAATRLPGKPLLPIANRPLIQWVWESACSSGAASVIVATDDERILQAALKFGADCVLTSPRHASGTDRIAEVAQTRGLPAGDIVVNLQGDEPMMPPAVICEIAAALDARAAVDIATAVAPIGSLEEFLDPSCVKALRGLDGRALYFSRAPVPARQALLMSVDSADDLGLFLCEREVMGFDHGAVGLALAQKWGLPRSLQECIEFHHEPGRAQGHPLEVATVHIANSAAVLAEIGSCELTDAPAISDAALRAARMDAAGVLEIVQQTQKLGTELLPLLIAA